ncbi:hypothetical protein L5515_000311 [Caenorhabditis briggsae]|uniref:Uncharacterized protein n=1 Tax=Caenorhabditis briggsae TaxID=6238 RepID=A0AAE9DY10_CAEBR|nr:hypothetical protein L5515_000311 [Caenorhabditis briggsae]
MDLDEGFKLYSSHGASTLREYWPVWWATPFSLLSRSTKKYLEKILGEDTPHRKNWTQWKDSFPNFSQSQRERILRPR